MKDLIKILTVLIILSGCNNVNDAAKIYRLGKRIDRVIENDNSPNPVLKAKTQNDWGLCTIISVDTLKTKGADYTVELQLPIDTTQSIELTIQMLPNMIDNFKDKEAIFDLYFIQTKTVMFEYRIKYIWIDKNKYDFEIINKIRQPNTRYS